MTDGGVNISRYPFLKLFGVANLHKLQVVSPCVQLQHDQLYLQKKKTSAELVYHAAIFKMFMLEALCFAPIKRQHSYSSFKREHAAYFSCFSADFDLIFMFICNVSKHVRLHSVKGSAGTQVCQPYCVGWNTWQRWNRQL